VAAKAEIILVGAAGRVGREIASLLRKHKTATLYTAVDHKGRAEATSLDRVRPIKHAVVIDFSTPESFRECLKWCLEANTPLVSGTTGLSPEDFKDLEKASKKIPILWSANMSQGINLFLNVIESLGMKLDDYDLQIEEVHHSRKKDAPSGTAKILRERIERVTGQKMPAPVSIRGGGVFGIHKLWMMNEDEIITIEHSALNRRVFASGAVQVATWLVGQKPGFYTMQDALRKKRKKNNS